MKRSQDREGSPRSKRSRSSYPGLDHDMGRDRLSPDLDRRGDGRGRMTKPYRDFEPDLDHVPRAKYREDRGNDGPAYGQQVPRDKIPEYRSLCISNTPSKMPDHVLKDAMYREFKKFGEFNVNVTYSGDIRVCYINFRYPEDARNAKHNVKLDIFDRPIRIEAVYNKRRSGSPHSEFRDHFRGGYGSPGIRHPGPPGGGFMRHPNGPPPPPLPPPRDMPPRDRDFNQYDDRRQKTEKFPHHLEHIDPEDDDKATRTLFVGNLDYNITEPELRRIFDRYGPIEEIDIKRPQRGQGNAYAFLKYVNLDCAHRAKVEMSGKYIGRFQCKIGYGKVTPSKCLWVGGIGPWLTHEALEREFDRFGVISSIEWPHGKNYAYVLYDSIEAAQAAILEMRGFPLGGQNRRLRVDFADPNYVVTSQNSPRRPEGGFDDRKGFDDQRGNWRDPRDEYDRRDDRRGDWGGRDDPVNAYRNPDNPRDSDRPRMDSWDKNSGPIDRRHRSPDMDRRSQTRSYDGYRDREYRENGKRRDFSSQDREFPEGERDYRRGYPERRTSESELVSNAEKMSDLAKCLPVAWNGALILKKSAFAARMHVVSGDVTIVDNLMRDPTSTETPVLKITQRLRLDEAKIEDVTRRISIAGPRGHCILLALPSTLQNYEDQTESIQKRPLKNLVTYLKQKEAAGIIPLPPYETKDKDNLGLLHAFPPCQFSYDYLLSQAPKLPPDPCKEDYLVIVVVSGA